MRIYEIAKEYNLSSKDILDFLQSMGIEKTAVAPLDREILSRIQSHFGITTSEVLVGTDLTIGPAPHVHTDFWTLYDTLGYQPYAYAIFRFLIHKQTQPPCTIGIQSPWGGGKTTLMRMIQNYLDPNALEEMEESLKIEENWEKGYSIGEIFHLLTPHPYRTQNKFANDDSLRSFLSDIKEMFGGAREYLLSLFRLQEDVRPASSISELTESLDVPEWEETSSSRNSRRFSIWFNASKYQNSNQIWAGLLDAIVRQISKRMRPRQRDRFFLQLRLHRQNADSLRKKLLGYFAKELWFYGQWLVGGLIVGMAGCFAASLLGWSLIRNLLAFFCLIDSMGLLGYTVWRIFNIYGKEAKESMIDFLDVPDYREETSSNQNIDRDLFALFQSLRQTDEWDLPDSQQHILPLYIFIDDVDRCSPHQIVKIMEGIQFFLAGEHPDVILILGMDPARMAAALDFSTRIHQNDRDGISPGYSYGWRYLEKLIQLPFDLPRPNSENLESFTRSLLGNPIAQEGIRWAREAIWNFAIPIKGDIPSHEIAEHILDELLEEEFEELTPDLREELLHPLIDDIESQRKERAILDEGIDLFRDDHLEIQKLLLERSLKFSSNPREIKRFLNVFRFRYMLWWRRQKQGFSNVSIDQMIRWVEFSLRWPFVLSWLQQTTLSDHDTTDPQKISSRIAKGLQCIEHIVREKPAQREEKLHELFLTRINPIHWIEDEGLIAFFQEEGRMAKGDRLSACESRGLY